MHNAVWRQLLNFFAFGIFSPPRILSAPIFFPLEGQPCFGLANTLQPVIPKSITEADSNEINRLLIKKVYDNRDKINDKNSNGGRWKDVVALIDQASMNIQQ